MKLNGRLNAFGGFVREYRPDLERLAARLCAGSKFDPEDLVSETLEQALHVFETLEDRDPSAVRGWLLTTMHQCFLEQCSRQVSDARPVAPPVPLELARLSAPALDEGVKKTIEMLRARFREVYAKPAPAAEPTSVPSGGATHWRM
ncbi:hypothetical protein JGU66_12850 [Myxococcaceae bacterium JPH2]|nr:hypothetical protein [Myxococcaceae bacterium JPH2]